VRVMMFLSFSLRIFIKFGDIERPTLVKSSVVNRKGFLAASF